MVVWNKCSESYLNCSILRQRSIVTDLCSSLKLGLFLASDLGGQKIQHKMVTMCHWIKWQRLLCNNQTQYFIEALDYTTLPSENLLRGTDEHPITYLHQTEIVALWSRPREHAVGNLHQTILFTKIILKLKYTALQTEISVSTAVTVKGTSSWH